MLNTYLSVITTGKHIYLCMPYNINSSSDRVSKNVFTWTSKIIQNYYRYFSVILVIFLLLLIVQLKLWLLNKLTFSCKYNEDDVASELQWPISVVICITVQIPHHLMHFLTVIHKQSKLENCSNNKSQGRFHSLAN